MVAMTCHFRDSMIAMMWMCHVRDRMAVQKFRPEQLHEMDDITLSIVRPRLTAKFRTSHQAVCLCGCNLTAAGGG